MFPKDIRYTTTHEWLRLDGDVATIGITKFATDQLSDITHIDLPSVGEELVAETVLGTIESVKAAVDLICPIDGEVVEINGAVAENPNTIGEDPYDDGWLVRMRPSDLSQLDDLMSADAYHVFVQAESGEERTEAEEEEEEEEDEEDEV